MVLKESSTLFDFGSWAGSLQAEVKIKERANKWKECCNSVIGYVMSVLIFWVLRMNHVTLLDYFKVTKGY